MRPLLLALLLLAAHSAPDPPPCHCLNGGTCGPALAEAKCECPPEYIGERCHLPATRLEGQARRSSLTTNYSYFYFVPREVNYYRMTFNICMLHNPSRSSALFYIETERSDGSLREVPSLFETARITLGQGECTSFSTHYISVKRRRDESFHKIVVGLRVMEEEDKDQYLNTYYNLQQQGEAASLHVDAAAPKTQTVSLQMAYEMYLQPSFIGTFAILFASFVLMALLVSFITYLRRKYTANTIDLQSLQDFHRLARSLHRLQRLANPQENFARSMHKYNLSNLERFMPTARYGMPIISPLHLSPLDPNGPASECEAASETCPICLIEFEREDEVRTTPCKHCFHRECIDEWFRNEFSCPMCRKKWDLRSEMRELYYQFIRNELIS